MFNVVSIVQEVLYALFQGYCLQYFLGAFLESRFSGNRPFGGRWSGLAVIVLYGVFRIMLPLWMPSGYEAAIVIGKQLLQLLLLFALALCFYRAAHAITVFLVVTFMAVSEISFFLAYMVVQAGGGLFDLWTWCMKKGYITQLKMFERILYGTVIGIYIVMYLVFCVIFYLSLKKIKKSFREKDYAMHRTELLFITTPGLIGFLICLLLRIIMVAVENGQTRLLYYEYPQLLFLVPAIMLLSLLAILYGVKLFSDMIFLNRDKNSRIILEKQIAGMQEHISEMERVYSGIRSMKHDMKNTLSVIGQLARGNGEKENEELQAYLSGLNRTMDRLEFQFKTGNAVVDTMLNMKYHEAVRTMPDLKMDADRLLFPDNLLIQSYDIGIILGNALDNAIEACRKRKGKDPDAEAFIRLSSFRKGKMIFIEIANSFDGNVILKRQAEFPATDKADREAHGIGLFNIKNAAEKYHGAVEWSANDKVFTLSVFGLYWRKIRQRVKSYGDIITFIEVTAGCKKAP